MDLNSLFDEKADSAPKREEVPFVPYLKKESKEHLAIKFLDPLSVMLQNANISHWVQGVGSVKCAKKPIKNQKDDGTIIINMWNGKRKNGEITNPEYDCVFCAEKFAAMDELKAREEAARKNPDLKAPTKEEGTKVNQIHDLRREFVARVEWRLQERQGKKVVEKTEWAEGFLRLRVTDLFSLNGKGYFKQLKSASEEETLMEHVWLMKPGSSILEKDAAISREEGEEITSHLDHNQWKSRVKEYQSGAEQYLKRKGAGNSAARPNTKVEQPEEQIPEVRDGDLELDDDLPF